MFRSAYTFALLILFSTLLSAHDMSYSLVDYAGVPLDEKLVRLMNFSEGVFVEAGAHDGITQSNTKRLEHFHGWTGVLVEPSPSLYDELVANRPGSLCYQCALGSFEEHDTYAKGDFDGALMSSVDGQRRNRVGKHVVHVRSLQSIFDEVGLNHVNLLSLDAEGYELAILKGIDFSRVTFDYLLIEIYSHHFAAIVSYLHEKGYDLVENFSNYSKATNPDWDGTHNDYLFKAHN